MTKELGDGLNKIGRTLAGGHIPSIAKAVFSHDELRRELLLKVMDLVNNEVDTLCRKQKDLDNPSPFRHIPVSTLQEFNFINRVSEMQAKCPFLYQLLIPLVQRNDHRNRQKYGDKHIPGLCLAFAILLKERNRQMCGVQT